MSLGLHLSDKIGRLLTRYEELSVDIVLRDEVSDLNEEGLDLEVRIGPIEDAVLIARCIGWTTAHLVAAPSYLEGHRPPAHPRDLERHDCIVYHRWGRDDVWWFGAPASDPGAEIAVNVRGWFRANNAAAVQRAAPAGHGIAMLSHLLVSEDIEKGRLRRLLPEYPSRRFPLYIAYQSRRGLPPRTRAVI
ncbi:MAG TPA: substrate binding domain-containing protein [Stellaceae bacterium]|nr:substrate binding domain-containing protein [Stellaceae bacterium]